MHPVKVIQNTIFKHLVILTSLQAAINVIILISSFLPVVKYDITPINNKNIMTKYSLKEYLVRHTLTKKRRNVTLNIIPSIGFVYALLSIITSNISIITPK